MGGHTRSGEAESVYCVVDALVVGLDARYYLRSVHLADPMLAGAPTEDPLGAYR